MAKSFGVCIEPWLLEVFSDVLSVLSFDFGDISGQFGGPKLGAGGLTLKSSAWASTAWAWAV